ncbi:phenylalanine--tRNA ligase subunit beta [Geodermatophilus sp. TF02-6]|uniref:phenylalanine--tRNA ligase subunit beta n=1 Tax=Geodermatophilus sp. TF02-6 TaxID=2250575 RepID=UPI000DE92F38|nr:phenylalanine--tRNA ligase subunit beta [Geodermatophilus sp. TF02-6]RBY82836.1 phenylalanine--tRNA ligase subunit beta [Geodermatophilus sp. TF02-6]
MRVPVGWLAEYVDLPSGTTVEQLDATFVRLGLEVEKVHRPEEVTGPLVVGRVLEVEELTGFKKPIRFCRVDVGEQAPRGIVCGARNFAVGDAVVVALPGAVLPGGFTIASRKTYDRISDGMICSARELGIGEDHTGILVLADGAAGSAPAPGTPAGPVVGLDDVVVELAITPDRGYCLSMRGIAREIGTGLGVTWRDPGALPVPSWSGEPAWEVAVADPDRCDRFSMIALEDLDPTAPTPWGMRRRLAESGVRSVSLAVDVTNYVMLELGQPMHAFDRDRVSGPIVVRRAREGERLTTLDGVDRVLDADDLLITDDSGPIGLAAVMGGASTEIGDDTVDVLLEAAHWEPTGVARTARRHRLPSEAAKRFERGVDPEMTTAALVRAAELLAEHGGARVVGAPVDVDTRGPRPTIPLDPALPGRVAGVPYPPARVTELLAAVGCAVDGATDDGATDDGATEDSGGGLLTVTPPSWRPDLTDPADLVEEVVRLAGYDDVPSVLPTAPPGRGLTEAQRRRRAIGRTLAEVGYVEAPSYPFVGPAALDALGLAEDDERRQVVVVRNPLSEEEPALRTTLLPGLLATLARNLSRGQRDLALFEHGAVFPGGVRRPAPLPGVDRRPDDETIAALLGAVPAQPWHVAVALAGNREPRGWWGPGRPAVWADAVQAARRVAEAAGVELTVRAGECAPWHPGRCAELLVGDGAGGHRTVGFAGELHPRVCAALALPARTSVMELDVDALPPAPVPVGPHISTFPPVLVDVALVVRDEVPAAEVDAALRAGAGQLLESLRLFDLYTGPPVPAGSRSLAYALTLRAPDRTLTSEEATAVRDAAVAAAAQRTGAQLRA